MNARNDERRIRAAMEFTAWLQQWSPEAYAAVMERVGEPPPAGDLNQLGAAWDMFWPSEYYPTAGYRGRWHSSGEHLSGLGNGAGNGAIPTTDTAGTGWADKVLDFAKEAVPAYFQFKTQRDIMDMNIERAKRGQPPIDPGVVAPQVKVIHDVPPQVQTEIRRFTAPANLLLWGGVAVGAFFLLQAMR